MLTISLILLTVTQTLIIAGLALHPDFGVLTQAAGRLALRAAAVLGLVGVRFDVILFDLDRLKQVNSATGAQHRTDELYRQAFRLRRSDLRLFAQNDNGDQFVVVVPTGQGRGLAERLQAQLAGAPLSESERGRLVDLTNGEMARLSATFILVTNTRNVLQAVKHGDREAFTAKAAGRRGQIVVL